MKSHLSDTWPLESFARVGNTREKKSGKEGDGLETTSNGSGKATNLTVSVSKDNKYDMIVFHTCG